MPEKVDSDEKREPAGVLPASNVEHYESKRITGLRKIKNAFRKKKVTAKNLLSINRSVDHNGLFMPVLRLCEIYIIYHNSIICLCALCPQMYESLHNTLRRAK